MTAILPERPTTALDALPPMAATAEPVVLPSLLVGVGITPRRVPAWITDKRLIESILAGFIDIPDELNPEA
ncbi:hypothetical protein [Streptomyces flavofungini]|uniref:hypothetical protein n=1 Tax=Streptomyces flavofungini TaxID=68200 RepID=UPI0034DEA4EB